MKKYLIVLFLAIFIIPSLANASVLYSQSINLTSGWNIISTPKVLDSHNFSVAETSNNFDIYALDASKTSGWSTMTDLGQTEFTPLYGYFINNKTGSSQTLTFKYKDVSIPEQLFNRTFTTPGWYSLGIANSSYAKGVDDDNTDINNPDNILQSLIGTSVHYGDVVDFTDANSSTSSLAVSNPLKSAIRSADISNSTEINTLKDFRETKGYAIYIKDSNVAYNGVQNKTIPQCQDGIDNDGDGNIDMSDTGCVNNIDNVEYTLPSKLAIKSSSSNPDSSNISVDEVDKTNDVLISAFKLDVGEDSSDIKINKIPIIVTITGAGASVTSADSVIDSLTIKIGTSDYDAYIIDSSIDNIGGDTAVYTVDVSNEDIVLQSGSSNDIKIYATFNEFGSNYSNGTTISASVNSGDIESSGVGTINSVELTGSYSGSSHRLNTSGFELSKYAWSSAAGQSAATLDFFFTIKAGNDDITLAKSDISETLGSATTGVLSLVSGDASGSGTYTISEGDTANFRVRYATTTDGTEVKITSIKGQMIPDDKQLSPTVYLQ